MTEELLKLIQGKADKSASMIYKVIEKGGSLEPYKTTINFDAIPCKVEEDGSFMVLTGTRIKPSGIGVDNPPDLVLLYNEKGGLFIPTSTIREIIKKYKQSLPIEIDSTYSIMGVRLNAGIISSYCGEDFLTALHQSSVHDS